MNVLQAIAQRRTIHDYLPDALPEGALERALQGAMAAPNHRMTEPWRFARVGRESRRTLVDISASLKSPGAPLAGAARQRLEEKMLHPAELLVVGQALHADPAIQLEDYAAIACALQNVMLCLWSEGIGTKWSTGAVTRDPGTYQLLGWSPEEIRCVGFLWAGKAAAPAKPKPPRRRPLADFLTELP